MINSYCSSRRGLENYSTPQNQMIFEPNKSYMWNLLKDSTLKAYKRTLLRPQNSCKCDPEFITCQNLKQPDRCLAARQFLKDVHYFPK